MTSSYRAIVEARLVRAAMMRPDAGRGTLKPNLWYQDELVNAALALGEMNGWVRRMSVTQVEYTEAGAEIVKGLDRVSKTL